MVLVEEDSPRRQFPGADQDVPRFGEEKEMVEEFCTDASTLMTCHSVSMSNQRSVADWLDANNCDDFAVFDVAVKLHIAPDFLFQFFLGYVGYFVAVVGDFSDVTHCRFVNNG